MKKELKVTMTCESAHPENNGGLLIALHEAAGKTGFRLCSAHFDLIEPQRSKDQDNIGKAC